MKNSIKFLVLSVSLVLCSGINAAELSKQNQSDKEMSNRDQETLKKKVEFRRRLIRFTRCLDRLSMEDKKNYYNVILRFNDFMVKSFTQGYYNLADTPSLNLQKSLSKCKDTTVYDEYINLVNNCPDIDFNNNFQSESNIIAINKLSLKFTEYLKELYSENSEKQNVNSLNENSQMIQSKL